MSGDLDSMDAETLVMGPPSPREDPGQPIDTENVPPGGDPDPADDPNTEEPDDDGIVILRQRCDMAVLLGGDDKLQKLLERGHVAIENGIYYFFPKHSPISRAIARGSLATQIVDGLEVLVETS